MRILIKTVGYIGDILFASSIAEQLKRKFGSDTLIDYCIGLVQPLELMYNNPHINKVYLGMEEPPNGYDERYILKPIHRNQTPCEQFQLQCGIKYPTTYYHVYTNEGLDLYLKTILEQPEETILIAYLSNWEERSFLFTEEQYKIGIDVPNLGYGGKHRDINFILNELNKNNRIKLIEVGKPNGYNQQVTDAYSVSEYSWTASLLKNCDYFIVAEGGLCNLAAGVGTKTIITGDFIHQLYGWNGVIEKCNEPKLGPKYYFPNNKHVTLNPYLTDVEVVEDILKIVL